MAKKIRKQNENKALKEAHSFREKAFNIRTSDESKDLGKDFRHVAEIPASLFFMLPKEIQENPKAMNEWLKKEGKEFLIVKKL